MPARHDTLHLTRHLSYIMGKGQKILTISLWAMLVLVMVGVVAGRLLLPRPNAGQNAQPLPVYFDAARFALVDQNGKPFGDADLRGKPYICDFVFTTCGSVCPTMSRKMMELQGQTPAGVSLVSFTVNPEHDTPAVLKEYAGNYKANPSRWHFLTGTTQQMTDVVKEMRLPFKPAGNADPILHSEDFLLVDGVGRVRGIYHSTDGESMRNLVADAGRLAASPGGRGE